MNNLVEGNHGHGAIHEPWRVWWERRFHSHWHDIAQANTPYDWSQPYAQPSVTIYNQGQAGSCGPSCTRHGYEITHPGIIISVKDSYSQVAAPGGGSSNTAMDALYPQTGCCLEALIASTNPAGPTDDTFMEERLQNAATAQNARNQTIPWSVPVNPDIDSVAQAIRDNGWVRITLYGQNNGTWSGERPLPPSSSNSNPIWCHFMCGAQLVLNGKKIIYCPQTWGTDVGAAGWQGLDEDYFKSGNILEVRTFPKLDLTNFKHTFASYLSLGMSGPEVLALQMALVKDGDLNVRPTGFFGTLTFSSVRTFQKKYGIISTGFVGPISIKKLNQLYAN